MSEWQRCPICDGHGWLSYPPGTPAHVPFHGTSVGPWQCHRCEGAGTIETPEQRVTIDTDWLRRKIAIEPDGMDCEAGARELPTGGSDG